MTKISTFVPCSPRCPGWFLGDYDDERGTSIQRCDDCARFKDDDEARAFPAARRALAAHLVPKKGHKPHVLRVMRRAALRAHEAQLKLAAILAWCETESASDATKIARIQVIAEEAIEDLGEV